MRVLVTGGAGYIGSVVADELLQAGHEVIVFDNLSRGHRQAVPKNADLVVGDLADRACLDQLLRSRTIDAVMHFAALIEASGRSASLRAFPDRRPASSSRACSQRLPGGHPR